MYSSFKKCLARSSSVLENSVSKCNCNLKPSEHILILLQYKLQLNTLRAEGEKMITKTDQQHC
jgi:hypothetical protein